MKEEGVILIVGREDLVKLGIEHRIEETEFPVVQVDAVFESNGKPFFQVSLDDGEGGEFGYFVTPSDGSASVLCEAGLRGGNLRAAVRDVLNDRGGVVERQVVFKEGEERRLCERLRHDPDDTFVLPTVY